MNERFMPSVREQNSDLIEQFVASFAAFGEMTARADDEAALSLAVGPPGEHGFRRWKPLKLQTDVGALEAIYSKLPARLPRLFEELVLCYRWAEVDLERFTLLANPPGDDLMGLYAAMSSDNYLWIHLVPSGFLRLAKGPGGDYDPVCFDIRSRKKSGDCPIVKIDHEQILCNDRIQVVGELAPSFLNLLQTTIERAKLKGLFESDKR
ncbi:MAG TPA: hypothetical protein VIM00_13835 [Candidatus Acidoferrum sp.]